ncbi:MAG: DEAD/DEAH box helicase family protein [bacterium]
MSNPLNDINVVESQTRVELTIDSEVVTANRSQDTLSAVGAVSLTGVIAGDTIERAFFTRNTIANRLMTYVEQLQSGTSTKLRAHQIDVFGDIASFVAQPPIDNEQPVTFGYVKLPTGSGKTAIFSTLAGILSSTENNLPPLKGLVLVPKLDLVDQTRGIVSEDGKTIKGGIGAFAPNTSVTVYTGIDKSLEGDVVVMTYDSLRNGVEAGILAPELFDYIICDEAHRALGKKTSAAINKIAEGRIVIGFTATTEFENKSVDSFFPEEIHSVELREAIELGWLCQVRAFAIDTGITIESIAANKDFSDAELLTLIESEWRNSKAVDFAKSFVEQGQQGLISCVPGDNLAHAKIIAERINETQILDPKTGELRNMMAVAVSGTLNTKERSKIYADFEAGLIDVLTYVDLLTEGWDSYKAQFLINLRPTSSPVNAVQRIGRVLRKVEGKIANVVEFIDRSERPIYTFWHAIGEDTIQQGKIIPEKLQIEQLSEDADTSLDDYDKLVLPDSLLELISSIEGISLREITVEEIKLFVNKDDLILRDVLKELHLTRRTLRRAFEGAGYELIITPKFSNGKKVLTINKESLEMIYDDLDRVRPRLEHEVFKVKTLAEQLSISVSSLTRILQEQNISMQSIAVIGGGHVKVGGSSQAIVIEEKDIERALRIGQNYVEETQKLLIGDNPQAKFEDGDMTIAEMKSYYGLGTKKYNDFLDSLGQDEQLNVLVEVRNGRANKFVRATEAERIYNLFVERHGYLQTMITDTHELARMTGARSKGISILDFEDLVLRGNASLASLFVLVYEGGKQKPRLPIKNLEKFMSIYKSL